MADQPGVLMFDLVKTIRAFLDDVAPAPGDILYSNAVTACSLLAHLADEARHERDCTVCGTSFTLTAGQVAWFQSRSYQLPRRCGKCRRANLRAEGRPALS